MSGFKLSSETKKKMSEYAKSVGRKPSKEALAKALIAMKKLPHPMLGRHHSNKIWQVFNKKKNHMEVTP